MELTRASKQMFLPIPQCQRCGLLDCILGSFPALPEFPILGFHVTSIFEWGSTLNRVTVIGESEVLAVYVSLVLNSKYVQF